MQLHITEHARKRMDDYNLSEKKLWQMFNKATECRPGPRIWGGKFARYGMKGLSVCFRYFTGWLFTYDDDRLVTIYEGAKKADWIFD